jgi:glucose-1-phosphate thymidylyltransferase
MKALILAAGYATRLYPLTKEYPKPLLKVGRRPIINYIIDRISILKDVNEIIVVTNSKFMPIFKKWAAGIKIKQRLILVDDLTKNHTDRLGAIGDMNFAIEQKHITDDLLVVGGDNLFDGGLGDFLSFAKAKNNSPVIGAYDIKDKEQAKKYGVIKMGEQSRIIDFKEKPKAPGSTLIAMCLYYFPKGKLGLVRQYLESKTDKYDAAGFYIDWLRKKEKVYGFVFNGRWYDIGHHEVYSQAKERFK